MGNIRAAARRRPPKKKAVPQKGTAQFLKLAFYHFKEDQFLRFSKKVFCEAQA